MSNHITLPIDRELREVIQLIGDKVHRDSRDRFLASLFSILLYSYVTEDIGPLEHESQNGLLTLVLEYFGRDPVGDEVERAAEIMIQAFKLRYETNDYWKEDLADLISGINRYTVDEVFTVVFTDRYRYAKVW